jgi:DNA-binding CsgD family transcriptional regulator
MVLLIGAPLAFAVTGTLHLVPAYEPTTGSDLDYVVPHWKLWTGIHVLQLVIISLLALAVAALTRGVSDSAASVSRVALVPFLASIARSIRAAGTSSTAYRLRATDSQRVAVIVEPAQPRRIVPLLMSVNGLTEREQQLTRLVLQGYSTLDIADYLKISVHTVQSHRRNIFTKTGVRADVILLPRSSLPTTSRGSETTNSARQRICHCVAGRLVPTARIGAPAGHRLSQQQSELRARQSEDRFEPMLALTRPPL